MTVDAHHHVWDLSVRDQEWIDEDSPLRRDFTVGDLAPEARAAGIDRTVLVQTVTVAGETPEFLALAAANDLIAGVVGWTDLTRPDVAEELARLRELPGGRYLKGVRHQVQGEPDPRWLLRADVRRGLTAVAAAGLVHDLVVLPHQLPACVEAAASSPDSRLSWTTRASHRSSPARWNPGRPTSGPSRRCPTPSANSPAWSPRPTPPPGPSTTCARTRTRSWRPSVRPG